MHGGSALSRGGGYGVWVVEGVRARAWEGGIWRGGQKIGAAVRRVLQHATNCPPGKLGKPNFDPACERPMWPPHSVVLMNEDVECAAK